MTEFKKGQKYQRRSNCIGEPIKSILTILGEENNKNEILVKVETTTKKDGEEIKKEYECFLGKDYLESRIKYGYIIKLKRNKKK